MSGKITLPGSPKFACMRRTLVPSFSTCQKSVKKPQTSNFLACSLRALLDKSAPVATLWGRHPNAKSCQLLSSIRSQLRLGISSQLQKYSAMFMRQMTAEPVNLSARERAILPPVERLVGTSVAEINLTVGAPCIRIRKCADTPSSPSRCILCSNRGTPRTFRATLLIISIPDEVGDCMNLEAYLAANLWSVRPSTPLARPCCSRP